MGLKKAALRLPEVLVNNIDFRRKKRPAFLLDEPGKLGIIEHQGLEFVPCGVRQEKRKVTLG